MIHSISHTNIAVYQQMSKDNPSEKTRQQIDENLKRVFQEQVDQELPDRFKDLLAQLKNRDGSKDKSGSQ